MKKGTAAVALVGTGLILLIAGRTPLVAIGMVNKGVDGCPGTEQEHDVSRGPDG